MDQPMEDALTSSLATVSLQPGGPLEENAMSVERPASPSIQLSKRVKAADLVPQLMKDILTLRQGAPQIKLEAVRTITRLMQGLVHAWTPEQRHQDFPRVITMWVGLLRDYRVLQMDAKGSTTEYSLMTDIEITDWYVPLKNDLLQALTTNSVTAFNHNSGYSDTIRTAFLSFKEFMENPQSINERRALRAPYLELKNLWHLEGQINSKRSKDIKTRRQDVGKLKFRPDGDATLSELLVSKLRPLLPTKAEEDRKERVMEEITNTIRALAPNARCHVFGSSANGFGFSTSDVDVALYASDFLEGMPGSGSKEVFQAMKQSILPESIQEDKGFQERESVTESSQDFLDILRPEGLVVLRVGEVIRQSGLFESVETICSARVPVVRMIHKNTKLQCDIAIGNELAVHNTRLLKAYSHLNSNSTMMIMCVKLWAKKRGIGDASYGFLSSYAWTLLALFYLQRIPAKWNSGGPTIPNLQTCDGEPEVDLVVDGFKIRYALRPASGMERYCANASIGALLRGFFAFYGGAFNFQNDSITFEAVQEDGTKSKAKPGTVMDKVELPIPKKPKNVMRWRFSIIDPFELTHDLGTTLSGRRAQIVINEEIWRAHSLLSSIPSLNPSLEQVQQALDGLFSDADLVKVGGRLCMSCGETGHRTKHCPTFTTSFDATEETTDMAEGNTNGNEAETPGPEGEVIKSTTKRKCYRCGASDHMAKNCPTMEAVKAARKNQEKAKRERDFRPSERKPFAHTAAAAASSEGNIAEAAKHQPSANKQPKPKLVAATAPSANPSNIARGNGEGAKSSHPSASKSDKSSSITCFRCGETGHAAKNCPHGKSAAPAEPKTKLTSAAASAHVVGAKSAEHKTKLTESSGSQVVGTKPAKQAAKKKPEGPSQATSTHVPATGIDKELARSTPGVKPSHQSRTSGESGETQKQPVPNRADARKPKKEMSSESKPSPQKPPRVTSDETKVQAPIGESFKQPPQSHQQRKVHTASSSGSREVAAGAEASQHVRKTGGTHEKQERGLTKQQPRKEKVADEEPVVVVEDEERGDRVYVSGANKYSFQELQQKSLEQKLIRSGISPLALLPQPPPPEFSAASFPPLSLAVDRVVVAPTPSPPANNDAPPQFKLPPVDKV